MRQATAPDRRETSEPGETLNQGIALTSTTRELQRRIKLAERAATEAGLSWRVRPAGDAGRDMDPALSSGKRGVVIPAPRAPSAAIFGECEVDWRARVFLDADE